MAVGDDNGDGYFFDVLSSTTKTSEQTIPDGDTWFIKEICIGAAGSAKCDVSLIWDYDGTPEILFASSNPTNVALGRSLVGDGTKKLAIVLRNNCDDTYRMGMIYMAEEV